MKVQIILKEKKDYLLLLLACLLVYYPILGNELLDFWDDQWVVMNIYTESGFTLTNIINILTHFYHGQYAPFNEYLYLLLYSIDGYNPFLFHLASLILHIFNVWLAYVVFKRMLSESGRLKDALVRPVSFFTAFLFAIHPFNVESVAWMSASKVLVYAFFYLLATYTYLLYIKSEKWGYYWVTLLLYIFSFLGKEQAVTFPMWMLLIHWLYGDRLSSWKNVMRVLPFFLLSLIFGMLTILSQWAYTTDITKDGGYLFWQRCVYACYAFTEYFCKSIVPYKLSYIYPFPSVVGEPLPTWLLVYPMLLGTVIIAFWNYLKRWYLFFGIVFFIIHIGITLHLISLSRFVVVADRYAYVASLGIAFLLSMLCVYVYRAYPRFLYLGVVILTSYVLYMGIYAHCRTFVWHDTDTLKYELRQILKHRADRLEGGE